MGRTIERLAGGHRVPDRLSVRARRRGPDGAVSGLLSPRGLGPWRRPGGPGLRGKTGLAAAGGRRTADRCTAAAYEGHTHGGPPRRLRRPLRRILPVQEAGDPPGHTRGRIRRGRRRGPAAVEVGPTVGHPRRGARRPAGRFPVPIEVWNAVDDGCLHLRQGAGHGRRGPAGGRSPSGWLSPQRRADCYLEPPG